MRYPPFSLLHALHITLRQDAAGNGQALSLFYETWRLEHFKCCKRCCSIPMYHDWACQMHGQRLQDLEDESKSDSDLGCLHLGQLRDQQCTRGKRPSLAQQI